MKFYYMESTKITYLEGSFPFAKSSKFFTATEHTFLTLISIFILFLSVFLLQYKKVKNILKSIRGFCPHHRRGARQSLAKPWVQRKSLNVPFKSPFKISMSPLCPLILKQCPFQVPLTGDLVYIIC